jgi:hypothetical protein
MAGNTKRLASGQAGGGGPGLAPSLPSLPRPPDGPTPAYPILTEELGYPPSPSSNGGNGASRGAGGNGRNGSLGPVVTKALQDVLGWKIKAGDAAGFVGALNQSFELKVVEGAVVSTWTPRSYVVQSDLAGGITGAQASVYTLAKTLVEQMLPIVDGLYPLDPASNIENVAAVKDVVTSQLTNFCSEIGYLGGPRVMRVQQYLQMLLGVKLTLNHPGLPPESNRLPASIKVTAAAIPPSGSPLRLAGYSKLPTTTAVSKEESPPELPSSSWTSPDFVLGSLGDLRDSLGLFALPVPIDSTTGVPVPNYVNTVEDEQNVTNFRVLVDYANSLLDVWTNNVQFFAGQQSEFLGTQLVVISRQLGVISEIVDEVRFVLDSVFIGPAQRQTLQIIFQRLRNGYTEHLPPIYLADLLQWIQDFVGAEAQDVIQNAGRFGLGDDFITMIEQLYLQAYGLYEFARSPNVPDPALQTGRVQQSLYKLLSQLNELYNMARPPIGVTYLPPRP